MHLSSLTPSHVSSSFLSFSLSPQVIERSGSDHLQQLAGQELGRWMAGYVDVAAFEKEIKGLKNSNNTLQDELQKLREANMVRTEGKVRGRGAVGEYRRVEERCGCMKRGER